MAYQRKRLHDHEVIDLQALDLPETTFTRRRCGTSCRRRSARTTSPARTCSARCTPPSTRRSPCCPLLAMCDRWDIGGLSTNAHPQTGVPTIFIYDGHPGGVGITARASARSRRSSATRTASSRVPVRVGCPSCVQSPKCGNLNEPLSKAGAIELMGRMLQRPRTGSRR
jgi:DEAD/DEAH box helicase domain-containing protein